MPCERQSEHHENSADASGQRSQKSPPIKMRMKIKDAHGAAKLPPAMFAGEKNRATIKMKMRPTLARKAGDRLRDIFQKF